MRGNNMLIPVILSGGIGSRLWPLSRVAHPKPFIKLDDGQSFIQKTYLRAQILASVQNIITVTNRELFFYTKDEYLPFQKQGQNNSFILEPFGRNSAPAIALAAFHAQEKYGEDCQILVMPADHLIEQEAEFYQIAEQAQTLAAQNKLVTFGIKPTSPNTGYGYIEARGNEVLRFVEKPDLDTAQIYLENGNFYWNSGMFCMKASFFLDELKTHAPSLYQDCKQCFDRSEKTIGENYQQIEIQSEDFQSVENISIDYAVFEKSDHVGIIPGDFGWSDIGSWSEFGVLLDEDACNNHLFGDITLEDVKNTVIHSSSRLVAALGVEDLIIADSEDALLIAHKDQAQNLGKIVKQLKSKNHLTYNSFPKVHRPWGAYTIIEQGPGYKVKLIEVKTGGKLSLQSHQHRSEHWVVVQGVAEVVNCSNLEKIHDDDSVFTLYPNQSTYTPKGNIHRLTNPSDTILRMIEVQCGAYLEEDDITRYDDIYGRKESI